MEKSRRNGDLVLANFKNMLWKLRESLPSTDAPDYKEKQKEFIDSNYCGIYDQNQNIGLAVYEDIRKTFLTSIAKHLNAE